MYRPARNIGGSIYLLQQQCFKRNYSEFLKGLPRTNSGGSLATQKIGEYGNKSREGPSNGLNNTSGRLDNSNQTIKDSTARPNRFADKYSRSNGPNRNNFNRFKNDRNPRESKGPSSAFPVETSETKKAQRYQELRQQLREKEKAFVPKPTKTNNSKEKNGKKRSDKVAKPKIKIHLPSFITVSNFANIIHIPLNDVIKRLELLGFENVRYNYILDKENAALIADEFDFEVAFDESASKDDLFPDEVKENLLKERPPVVTIMGHVDHGKTTILDHLRKTSVVKDEFGGITQHIGAFSVITPVSKKHICFLDTPGHAAFLKMRERGAIITDIVILVVAADDSVMPQTIEAIKHAKRSGVPMIVALNKCDKPGINIDKVLADLSSHDIDVEDYGGETQTVKVSGKTGLNMDKLEEAVITLGEMLELRSEYANVRSEAWIIESQVLKGVGNMATVLVRRGTVKVGDVLVAGTTYCKVRGMKDQNGKTVKSAGPSTPVQIWGWKELPESGDHILQAKNEQTAKKVIDSRIYRSKQIQASRDIETINLKRQEEIEDLEKQERLNELKLAGLDTSHLEKQEVENKCIEVKYIIKSDVFGSAEAIKESIAGLGNDEVRAVVVSHDAGVPSDSDVDLAKTLNAKILCFNVNVGKKLLNKAHADNVSVVEHNIIYRLIEDVTSDLTALLKPKIEIKTLAEIEIKGVFNITSKSKSKMKIAGCKVLNGNLKRSSTVKVLRNQEVIYSGSLSSLKHVKDDISEAKKGSECGITFENWDNFEPGDKVEVFEEIRHQRYL